MLSVIICSIDDARFVTADAMYRRQLAGEDFEIIRIPDARSMSEGYNRGVQQSRGDVLIFSHDDVELARDDWWPRVRESLKQYDVIGLAGTVKLIAPQWAYSGPPFAIGQMAQLNAPAPGYLVAVWNVPAHLVGKMQALDGVWMCAKRSVAERIDFDEQTFTGFHLYDLDFTFRAHQAGFTLAVRCDLLPFHASKGNFKSSTWMTSAQQFMRKHRDVLEQLSERDWSMSRVKVATKAEAIEVMTPPWWPPEI